MRRQRRAKANRSPVAPRLARLTNDQVLAGRSPKGGWSAATLASWGVPWPPPHGWRRAITIGGGPVLLHGSLAWLAPDFDQAPFGAAGHVRLPAETCEICAAVATRRAWVCNEGRWHVDNPGMVCVPACDDHARIAVDRIGSFRSLVNEKR